LTIEDEVREKIDHLLAVVMAPGGEESLDRVAADLTRMAILGTLPASSRPYKYK